MRESVQRDFFFHDAVSFRRFAEVRSQDAYGGKVEVLGPGSVIRPFWRHSDLITRGAMPNHLPNTETMKISEVRPQLNSLVNRVYRQEARIIVEKSGIPVAGIVSPQDMRRLERLSQERAQRFSILEEFGEAFRDVPEEELEREVAQALAEVRAERRAP